MYFQYITIRSLIFSKVTRIDNCKLVPIFSQLLKKSTATSGPPALEDEFQTAREKFLKLEAIRDSVVDFDLLTEEEKLIHEAHREAVQKWHFTYEDPFDEGKVYTRYRHTLLGRCCGNACRHCVFNYYNVPELLKKNKKFNGSFWTIRDPSLSTAIEIFKDLKDGNVMCLRHVQSGSAPVYVNARSRRKEQTKA